MENFGHIINFSALSEAKQRALDFQEAQPTRLLEQNFYIPALDYYAWIQGGFFVKYPDLKQEMKPNFHKDTIRNKTGNITLTMATYNLSSRFDNEKKDDIRIMYQLPNEFYKLTGTICSLYNKKPADWNLTREYDTLLVCHPVTHKNNDPDLKRDHDDHIKSTFFAFLWQKGLITEKQLYTSGAMLGQHHHGILREKERLNALGIAPL